MQAVERLVAGEHPVDQVVVALDQPLDGEADVLLGEAAHFEQPRLELFELLLEVADDAFDRLH